MKGSQTQNLEYTQWEFTCSKLTMKILKKGV